MEEQLVRLIRSLITQLLSDEQSVEVMIDKAFENAEVVISPSARDELVQFLHYKLLEVELPN